MEGEADGDVAGGWDRSRAADGRVGDELKGHGRGVVGHAVEVSVHGWQAGETEVGGKGCVVAELYSKLALSAAGDGGVQELGDLSREGHAGNGAGVVGCVESEVPLVLVGESAELEENVLGEEVGVCDGGIVDFGDVHEIPDCSKVSR